MKKFIISLGFTFAPVVALAQAAPATLPVVNDANGLLVRFISVLNVVTYILVALAVLFIVYNVVWYIIKPSSSEEKGTHGMNILWGIVGLFIIVSIWGLVNILTNTVKTNPGRQPIPNAGNVTENGGIPANQIPLITQ
jgi:hypothetical protein